MCIFLKTTWPALWRQLLTSSYMYGMFVVMLSEFGHWSQSLQVSVNRRPRLVAQKGSNRVKFIFGRRSGECDTYIQSVTHPLYASVGL